MKKKVKAGIIAGIIIFALFVATVNALTSAIGSPRVVLYKNISKGETLEFQNSVIVQNHNDYAVNITLSPIEVWEDKVFIKENNFSMQQNENKEVNYTIKIAKAGYYDGDILITFSDSSKNTLSVAQNLVVIVSDEHGKVPKQNSLVKWYVLAAVLLVILIIAIIILNYRRNP